MPGFGVQTVDRLLAARRVRRLRHADLARLHVPLKGAAVCGGGRLPPRPGFEAADLAAQLALSARATQFVLTPCSATRSRWSTPPTGPAFAPPHAPWCKPMCPPQAVDWRCQADAAEDLFAPRPQPNAPATASPDAPTLRVPPTLCACASSSSCTATRPLCADVPPAVAHGAGRR